MFNPELSRVKAKDFNGNWRYGNIAIDKFNIIWLFEDGFVPGKVAIEVQRDTICRCTGKRDKNGKLLFEFDTVSYYWPCCETEKKLGYIKYVDDEAPSSIRGFSLFHRFPNGSYGQVNCEFNQLEFTGNIHDKE